MTLLQIGRFITDDVEFRKKYMEEEDMDEKYMQSDWIGENKVNDTPVCEKIEKLNQLTNMQKYYISILEECMDLGDHEKIKKLNLLIKLQKEYISNLEEGVDLRDQLIKKYEGWVNHDITTD